jgi:simple sugar transport system permease protein
MGISAWIFALVVHFGLSPFLGIGAALLTGMALGACVGGLVVTAGLSSLIATLGMNFMLRGFILIITQGKSIALLELQDTTAGTLFAGQVFGVPVQIFWALGFVVFAGLLFNHHKFGARVRAVGDNPDSAGQMGVNVAGVRILTFVFMGLGAALAGVFSTMVNYTWWPTTGDGYLLPAIASVFVGGTPTWGGVGTIAGGAIGALTVSFIQSGIVAAGLSGFYVQFFNGLIIILALLGHRWNQKRYR